MVRKVVSQENQTVYIGQYVEMQITGTPPAVPTAHPTWTPQPTTPAFANTPTPTSTRTATITRTPTKTVAKTATPTRTRTVTVTRTLNPATYTATITRTITLTRTITNTSNPSSTVTLTRTAPPITRTPTATTVRTSTRTPTKTKTGSPTATHTLTFTPTRTPILLTLFPSPTDTPTHTATPIPPLIPAGQIWKFYYYAGSQRIAMRYKMFPNVNAYGFLLSDHLGSTNLIVSSTGTQEGRLLYRAFGEERGGTGTMPTDYRYTGQLAQADIGLYYYGARWYDPKLGRFTQADSIIPQPGNPLDWDRYAYVRNSPVNYTDPSGHEICSDDGYCGSLGDVAYQIHIFSEAITEIYKWTLQGTWRLNELKIIYTTAHDIRVYVDGLSNGQGLNWIHNYLGGVTFAHISNGRSHVLPGNRVNLVKGWEKFQSSKYTIAHELGHVWDNNSAGGLGVYLGGGVADYLNDFIGGNVKNSIWPRWINPDNKNWVDPYIKNTGAEYDSSHYYGNGSTADYLADAFANGIYDEAGVPQKALLWVRTVISLEVSLAPSNKD